MEQFIKFLDSAHSIYHAVAYLENILNEAGYTPLSEGESWELKAGGKYYFTRGGSSLVAFRIPQRPIRGFLFTASHSDRPGFKLKENGQLAGTYNRVSTEPYGGAIISTWLDRPLSVAGRVVVEGKTGIETRLLDISRDLLLIPNVAIHLNRKVNEGYAWNPTVDTLPLLGGQKGTLGELLEEAAGGKILGQDLYLYLRQGATVWGANHEYISAAGLDDLQCLWGCAQGFLQAGESADIPVLCVFDSEEVGSCSAQGAESQLLAVAVSRICRSLQLPEEELLSRSFLLSADNAHGLHPNHPELSDATNAPVLGGGVVLKFNANLRYATDGAAASVLRQVCQKADVPVQTYYNRADIPGGSTLGRISLGNVSVPTADIGVAQLAMHSAYETAAVQDTVYLQKAVAAYYGSTLETSSDGSLILK